MHNYLCREPDRNSLRTHATSRHLKSHLARMNNDVPPCRLLLRLFGDHPDGVSQTEALVQACETVQEQIKALAGP